MAFGVYPPRPCTPDEQERTRGGRSLLARNEFYSLIYYLPLDQTCVDTQLDQNGCSGKSPGPNEELGVL